MAGIPTPSTVVNDHGSLISWALRKLHVPTDQHEDARQGGALGLLVALDRYQPEKGRYRSFAASHVLEQVRIASGLSRKARLRQVELCADERHPRAGYTEDGFDMAEYSDARAAARRFLDSLNGDEAYIASRIYGDLQPRPGGGRTRHQQNGDQSGHEENRDAWQGRAGRYDAPA